jgi:hypothetical protein
MNRQALSTSVRDARASDRVRRHTTSHVNEAIDRQTRARLDDTIAAGRDAMLLRLHELDHEWDVDRALMMNFAVAGGLTFTLGQRHHRGWLYLFAAQLGFLGLHATAGWCPPVPVFRRLGFRTAKEIATERTILVQRLADTSDA